MLCGIAAAVVVLLVPRDWRLPASLAFAALWLSLGQLADLGPIQAVSKATGFAAFLLVIAATFFSGVERARLPGWLWLYPVVAGATLLWIINSEQRLLFFFRQFQWVLLMVAAIQTARTMTTERAVLRVIIALAVGAGIASIVTFMSVLRNPASIVAGIGRFFPWGANPNQIGTVYILAGTLLAYGALRVPMAFKIAFLAVAGIAVLQALLTASRSTNFPLFLLIGIIGIRLIKRPVVLLFAIAAGVVAAMIGGRFIAGINVERLTNLDTTRNLVFAEFIGSFLQSPVLGKFFSGVDVVQEATADQAHNAYIEMASDYGLVIAIPMFLLGLMSLWAAFRVWKFRRTLDCDPLLITLLAALLALSYLHGMGTVIIYASTYAWSLVHVALSCFFIGVWTGSLRLGRDDVIEYSEWADSEAYVDADGAVTT